MLDSAQGAGNGRIGVIDEASVLTEMQISACFHVCSCAHIWLEMVNRKTHKKESNFIYQGQARHLMRSHVLVCGENGCAVLDRIVSEEVTFELRSGGGGGTSL